MVIDLAFQLKGGLFPLTTLQIFSCDLSKLQDELSLKIAQAPNFFNNAPIVLDLRIANQNESLDFAQLKNILKSTKLIPVGIKNANPEQIKDAAAHGFAVLRDTQNQKESEKKLESTPQVSTKTQNSKLITDPVRSGQQIYAPDGDLIILNHVSPGSELIADGNIHVYGALRGRAIAGINGNTDARIFCKSLEAELVSVAGNYKISEDIERQAWKVPAQVYIKQDRLQISLL